MDFTDIIAILTIVLILVAIFASMFKQAYELGKREKQQTARSYILDEAQRVATQADERLAASEKVDALLQQVEGIAIEYWYGHGEEEA
jgi:hypothetical protein